MHVYAIRNLVNEKVYIGQTLTEASIDLKVSVTKISLVCRGIRKHTRGLVSKYVEELKS